MIYPELLILTLCILMNSSISFNIMNLGWFIIHIKGLEGEFSKLRCSSAHEDCFNLANSADPDEMPKCLHCLPKYLFRGLQYTKG